MISTESKLWRHMKNELDAASSIYPIFDRIESPITPGASDTTYVAAGASGWVELKTAKWPRPGRPLRLRCEFTVAQASWLLTHHKPLINLKSWLLIGILGPSTWSRFLLAEAPAALLFMEGRPRPGLDVILTNKGVYNLEYINDVLTRIRS